MLADLKVTLYEILGYVFPGLISVAALITATWALFYPTVPFQIPTSTLPRWIALGILAYLAGHLTQAVANRALTLPRTTERKLLESPAAVPTAILNAARQNAADRTKIPANEIPTEWIYRIADETIFVHHAIENRTVYQYREGFYRGLTIAFAAHAISLVIATIRLPQPQLAHHNQLLDVPRMLLASIAGLSLVAAWLAHGRYRRFAQYRITDALLGALLLPTQPPTKPNDK